MGKKPIKVIRVANFSASIFKNISKKGKPYFAINLQKAYQIEGKYIHKEVSFNEAELNRVISALEEAKHFLTIRRPK